MNVTSNYIVQIVRVEVKVVSFPASLFQEEKESGEKHIQFWFQYTYV